MRVAGVYFTDENRAVAIYYRRAVSDAEDDPRLTELDDEERDRCGRR